MTKAPDIKKLKGLTQDSRAVKEGYLFAALPGAKTDGRKFIADAVLNGAKYILAVPGTEVPAGVILITDENPRRRLALMAAEFYGRQPERIVAVTGTNGKTSTVHFTKQIWKALGYKAASIGTLGVRAPGMIRSGSMTTPDPVTLHAELADLAAAGITHLAMEASSHGLDQYRLDGVTMQAAGFTNLTRDHLDYHGSMEAYSLAKLRLFNAVLKEGGVAVINADEEDFAELTLDDLPGKTKLGYGKTGHDIQILSHILQPAGQNLRVKILGKTYEINLPFIGNFQAMNALCALGLVLSENLKDQNFIDLCVSKISDLRTPPGRLQLVPGHAEGAVYVDYAHTPDALENILKALRPHTEGKLVCVFGCGGDRDKGKRPVMGKIAHDLADDVIVTDDNPRSEDPATIRREILTGAPGAKEIGNRHEAIRTAIKNLNKGDVLVIAGKGHEQGQIFADRTDPFDDVTEAALAIKEQASL